MSKASKTPDKQTFLQRHDIVVGQKLDSGGFGIVYKGLMKGKMVAIKVMRLGKVPKEDIDQELKILRLVKHKSIVRIDQIQRTHHHVWIVMELAAGGSIGKWVRRFGHIGPWLSRYWILCCFEALQYLHSQKIAHRDLKLDNILLDEYCDPKLTDFGLSRFFDESKDRWSTTFCGTRQYMALEVHQRQKYNPMVADIWSLGVCLFMMLSGESPFERHDEQKMLKQMQTQDFQLKKSLEIVPAVEERAMNLLKKMMDPNPATRISLADCLTHEFIKNPYH